MFFIFGWGHRTNNDRGPTMPANCPNCHNDSWFHFFTYRTWFTLFFIPVIPYESKSFLLCPVCSSGLELNGEPIDAALRLNEAAQAFHNNEIGEMEFTAALRETRLLSSDLIGASESGIPALPEMQQHEHPVGVPTPEASSQRPLRKYAVANVCMVCREGIGRFGSHEEATFEHESCLCSGNVHGKCLDDFRKTVAGSSTLGLYMKNFSEESA